MDVHESKEALQKHSAVETSSRSQLVLPANKNNGTTRRREVSSSRYRSPAPSIPSGPRRCISPNASRTATTTSQLVPKSKRPISAERKRPSTPPRPSTPVHDILATEMQLASRKVMGSRLPEVLWPSTMRSLSVSFQSDTFSLPISKKEKPVTHALADRALKPSSSNVAQKQAEIPPVSVSRKPTPERKRSPLRRGKNATDQHQSENSKPVDVDGWLHARLVDQHRWPSRAGGKLSSNASLTKSIDLTDQMAKTPTLPTTNVGIGMFSLSLRRMSFPDGMSKPLQKSTSEAVRPVPYDDCGNMELEVHSQDNDKLQEFGLQKPVSSRALERMNPEARSQSLPTAGSRPPSPSKASIISSSVSRGVSPSQTRALNAAPRGISPSQIRTPSPSRQSSSSSVLSYIADIRKGNKGANHIEDAHQLRLLYNKHLQWRYANAQAGVALYTQKATTEKTLFNVWRTTSKLWDSVTEKRFDLQQLRLKLMLYSVLNEQMAYLEDWASIERDHISSLSWAIEDLQSTTLRLPVTGGARADIETLKAAVCSAVEVIQAMGSSMCSILLRVEGMNCLVSELADVAAQERAMFNDCEALLASTAAMQVEEYNLRTHLIQVNQNLKNDQQPIYGNQNDYMTIQMLS